MLDLHLVHVIHSGALTLLPVAIRMRFDRTVLRMCWVLLGAWAVWLFVLGQRTSSIQPTLPGARILLGSAAQAEGRGQLSLLPRDSAVAVLVTTAECAAGRAAVPAMHRLAIALGRAGVAFRIVVKSHPAPAHQYARLYPRSDFIVRDVAGDVLGPLDTTVVPSLFVLDRRGVLVLRYAPLDLVESDVEPFAARVARASGGPGRRIASTRSASQGRSLNPGRLEEL